VKVKKAQKIQFIRRMLITVLSWCFMIVCELTFGEEGI